MTVGTMAEDIFNRSTHHVPKIQLPPPTPVKHRSRSPTSRKSISPMKSLSPYTNYASKAVLQDRSLSVSQRDLLTRVIKAEEIVRQWCQDIESWSWSRDHNEKTEGHVYWGLSSSTQATEYENQLDSIQDELEQMDIDEMKERILSIHQSSSRPSSSASNISMTKLTFLDDFSYHVTKTLLQLLPNLSKLTRYLRTWTIRLTVLNLVPQFLERLVSCRQFMKSLWSELESIIEESQDTIQNKQLKLDTCREKISTIVATTGQTLDTMLDLLEGQDDTLPDDWIDDFERTEKEVETWSIAADQRIFLLKTKLQSEKADSKADSQQQKLIAEISLPTVQKEGIIDVDEGKINPTYQQDSETIVESEQEKIQREVEFPSFNTTTVEKEIEIEIKKGINKEIKKEIELIALAQQPEHRNSVSQSGSLNSTDFEVQGDSLTQNQDNSNEQEIYSSQQSTIIIQEGVPTSQVQILDAELKPGFSILSEVGSEAEDHNGQEIDHIGQELESHVLEPFLPNMPPVSTALQENNLHDIPKQKAEEEEMQSTLIQPMNTTIQPNFNHLFSTESEPSSPTLDINSAPNKEKVLHDYSTESISEAEAFPTFPNEDDLVIHNSITSLDYETPQHSPSKSYQENLNTPNVATPTIPEYDEMSDFDELEMTPSRPMAKVPEPTININMKKRGQKVHNLPIITIPGDDENDGHNNNNDDDDDDDDDDDNDDNDIVSLESQDIPLPSIEAHTPLKSPVSPMLPLQEQISSILSALPTPIRLKSGPSPNAPDVKRFTTRSRTASIQSTASTTVTGNRQGRSSTPFITLAPANENHGNYSVGRSNARRGKDPDVQLYHLIQTGRAKPIKLFIRRVGEGGDRVMVRVGGGWADLGEYLRNYAEHHSAATRAASEGAREDILEITPVEKGATSTSGNRRTSNAARSRSGTPAPGNYSRPASALDSRATPRNSSAALRSSPPPPNATNTTPLEAVPLAGPYAAKRTVSGEKREWIEGIVAQAKKSLGKEVGDLGKTRTTRRIFFKNKSVERGETPSSGGIEKK